MISFDYNKPPVIAVSSGLGGSGREEGAGGRKKYLPKKILRSMSLPVGFNLGHPD